MQWKDSAEPERSAAKLVLHDRYTAQPGQRQLDVLSTCILQTQSEAESTKVFPSMNLCRTLKETNNEKCDGVSVLEKC